MDNKSGHGLKILGFEYQCEHYFSIFIIKCSTYYKVYADFDSVWSVGIFYYSLLSLSDLLN